jgi:hypothetical protein
MGYIERGYENWNGDMRKTCLSVSVPFAKDRKEWQESCALKRIAILVDIADQTSGFKRDSTSCVSFKWNDTPQVLMAVRCILGFGVPTSLLFCLMCHELFPAYLN